MPNLYPTDAAPITELAETKAEITFGKSWRFDFEKGDFVQTPTGKVATSTEEDAWLEWCQKAILTDRYRYLIYGRNHGQEFEDLIRRNLSRAGNESEIKRIITECLMVDPRTASVDNFTFTWDGDRCFFTCQVTSIREVTGTVSGEVAI